MTRSERVDNGQIHICHSKRIWKNADDAYRQKLNLKKENTRSERVDKAQNQICQT